MGFVPVVLAVLLSLGCVLSARFFLGAYSEENFIKAFWLKGAAAVFFVAVGAVLLWVKGMTVYTGLTLGGLFLGLLGDQLLAMRLIHRCYHDLFFTVGAASFAVGHFLYMAALHNTGTVKIFVVLPVLFAAMLISYVYGKKNGTDFGEKTITAVAYICVVLLMASVAICVAVRTVSVAGFLFALGGILFSVSDNILCAYCYGKKPVWKMNRDLHIAYYGAQLAIAWSILFA